MTRFPILPYLTYLHPIPTALRLFTYIASGVDVGQIGRQASKQADRHSSNLRVIGSFTHSLSGFSAHLYLACCISPTCLESFGAWIFFFRDHQPLSTTHHIAVTSPATLFLLCPVRQVAAAVALSTPHKRSACAPRDNIFPGLHHCGVCVSTLVLSCATLL